jgi:hypothetical protein
MRRIPITAACVAAGASLLVAFPSPAHATAQACITTYVPPGTVCNTTYGSGARVDQIDAVRNAKWVVVNPGADASVLDGRNHSRVKWFQHQERRGDYPLRVWFRFYPRRIFACGDVTSVAWYESGGPKGGYVNVTLC